MRRIFLTHPPDALRNYCGDKAIAELSALGDVVFNEAGSVLSLNDLAAAAAGCQVIVSDRQTPGEAGLFRKASVIGRP